MGYGFDVADFVQALHEVVADVTVKDLTQVVRRESRKLSLDSRPGDIVSAIQDVHAFSDLMRRKIASKEYEFMSRLMFTGAEVAQRGKNAPGGKVTMVMRSPDIKIAPDLADKKLEITVHRAIVAGVYRANAAPPDLEEHKVEVKVDAFCNMVNKAFGSEGVLHMSAGLRRKRYASRVRVRTSSSAVAEPEPCDAATPYSA